MSSSFAGQTAIVSGAARGIGRAVARELAARGANIVGVDVLAEVNSLAAELAPEARAVQGDLTQPSSIEATLAAARELPGRLGVLVNCAFSEERALLLESTPEGWSRTFDVSLHAAVNLSRAFVAELNVAGGAIVNIVSVHAFGAAARFGPYSAAKSALLAFTRTAALEWGALNVRVNAIAPGFVAVERNAHIWRDPAALQRLLRNYPIQRPGQPADIARCVCFLASDDASFVTGAVLPVDGGLTARLPEVERPEN